MPERQPGPPPTFIAVGSKLRVLLLTILALFALLAIDGGYLAGVTFAEWLMAADIQGYLYQYAFLAHLAVGLLLIVPLMAFLAIHFGNAWRHPNRLAVRAGIGLLAVSLILVVSGIVLMRIEGIIDVRDASAREVAYWAHVVSPLAAMWIFVLHRLAGPPIRWRIGISIGAAGAVSIGLLVWLHAEDPRTWNEVKPESGDRYFFPSLSRTATGGFIPADALMMDEYCAKCHADVHAGWKHSAHRFSSFNNPVYRFSVRETRAAVLARDGTIQASRFCAGCHDPVPLFSGAFDDPSFDDERHPTAPAGITCTVCHSITAINTVRGNGDYTIEEPVHYPFAYSDNPVLQWVNEQLIKAKPAFHKRTFLKPLHETAEFCGTCHKVHLPEELNDYKWLRGQNHYDAFLLSGVSGHGIESFYYPPNAEQNCNQCHMPLAPSGDFGAADFDGSGVRKIHDHQFPSANTALQPLLDLPPEVNRAHQRFLEGTVRVDIFGVRRDGTIDGKLLAPVRPAVPALEPGRRYLFEVVVRTLKLGHLFTQGTADSNEVWLDVVARCGDQIIGRSGGRRDDGKVDPWSHFVNAYVLDRDGNRIDRRNAQDIFVALYDHQIPPGAADVVHYALTVPPDATEELTLEVSLRYRKFDHTLMEHVFGPGTSNELPIVTIANDRVRFGLGSAAAEQATAIPEWQRWNDYGIGLMRKGTKGSTKGELRQAERAFEQVERLGRADGPLNRARVYLKEGRLADAVEALDLAAAHDPPAPPWSVAWFTGLVNRQNGNLDAAIANFESVAATRFQKARDRGFDFGQNYVVQTALAQVLFDRAQRERGNARADRRDELLRAAVARFERALRVDPEYAPAHYGLAQAHASLGDDPRAVHHRELHAKYKLDDNARDRVIRKHRSENPAADHAADPTVIYDLQRPGAYGR